MIFLVAFPRQFLKAFWLHFGTFQLPKCSQNGTKIDPKSCLGECPEISEKTFTKSVPNSSLETLFFRVRCFCSRASEGYGDACFEALRTLKNLEKPMVFVGFTLWRSFAPASQSGRFPRQSRAELEGMWCQIAAWFSTEKTSRKSFKKHWKVMQNSTEIWWKNDFATRWGNEPEKYSEIDEKSGQNGVQEGRKSWSGAVRIVSRWRSYGNQARINRESSANQAGINATQDLRYPKAINPTSHMIRSSQSINQSINQLTCCSVA